MTGTGDPEAGRLLRADARFTQLPRPEYDIDARGLRPQTAATIAIGGAVLVAAAPYGAWLRVTRRASATADIEVVQEVLGLDLSGGELLALLGLLSFAVGGLWLRPSRWSARVAHAIVGVTAVTAGVLLLQLQGRIGEATAAAIDQAGFYDLTPGAGWGAWAALVGATVLVLSSVYGAFTDPSEPGPDHWEDRP